MTRTYQRRRPTPSSMAPERLTPWASVDLTSPTALAPYRRGRPLMVICTAQEPPHVLIGLKALSRALQHQADALDAWIVECSPAEGAQIAAADQLNASDAQLAQAVTLLRSKGVPSVHIAKALGLRPWGVSRLAAANGAGERLTAVLSKGSLPFSHTRLLAPMPPADQAIWTERAVAGAWSYRRLEREIALAGQPPSPQGSPDLGAFVSQLSEQLGTEVQLEWPDDRAKRRLILTWYSPEDLKGLLAKLAAGPETTVTSTIRRELVIALDSADDLDALTGHLVTN